MRSSLIQVLRNFSKTFYNSRPTSAENEYVMKCIMRSFSTLQAAVIPYLSTLLTALTQKLQLAAKNPTKPHYNHYLFESLSLSIRIVCKEQPSAVANFESVLFPVFQEILQVSRALRKIRKLFPCLNNAPFCFCSKTKDCIKFLRIYRIDLSI